MREVAERACCALCCALIFGSVAALIIAALAEPTAKLSVGSYQTAPRQGDNVLVGEERGDGAKEERERRLRIARLRNTSDKVRSFASTPPTETILRIKAVQAFLRELEKAATTANQTELHEAINHPPHDRPSLVETRRYSGRLQTGCIGGCF